MQSDIAARPWPLSLPRRRWHAGADVSYMYACVYVYVSVFYVFVYDYIAVSTRSRVPRGRVATRCASGVREVRRGGSRGAPGGTALRRRSMCRSYQAEVPVPAAHPIGRSAHVGPAINQGAPTAHACIACMCQPCRAVAVTSGRASE